MKYFFFQLSDKDVALLEERIKRSAKTRPNTSPKENAAKSAVPGRGSASGGGADSSAATAGKKKEDKKPTRPQIAK